MQDAVDVVIQKHLPVGQNYVPFLLINADEGDALDDIRTPAFQDDAEPEVGEKHMDLIKGEAEEGVQLPDLMDLRAGFEQRPEDFVLAGDDGVALGYLLLLDQGVDQGRIEVNGAPFDLVFKTFQEPGVLDIRSQHGTDIAHDLVFFLVKGQTGNLAAQHDERREFVLDIDRDHKFGLREAFLRYNAEGLDPFLDYVLRDDRYILTTDFEQRVLGTNRDHPVFFARMP